MKKKEKENNKKLEKKESKMGTGVQSMKTTQGYR